ncbi:MAG: PA0069 family radical SAM protein [Burkholderiales bacterium]|nr:PA0069 family radical SAM protein [Burkholderiales bacterium]
MPRRDSHPSAPATEARTGPPLDAGAHASTHGARRGRGATYNPDNRYHAERREAFDDGWAAAPRDPRPDTAGDSAAVAVCPDTADAGRQVRTTVTIQPARTIVTRNASPDIPFTQSINPYQGCEHGCVYCYARPSHAYLDHSPGLDFETKLYAKPDAAKLLRDELSRPGYACDPIALGTNTDPYQPIERDWRITRSILEVFAETSHPYSIVTKNALVLRDLDLIAPMARRGLARVCLSVTTLDADLARRMEPRASAPARRIAALRELARSGVPAGVMVAPVIPQLNDREIESILEAAGAAGATSAGWIMLRLPREVAPLFRDWLETHYRDRAGHVMNIVHDLRDGRDYRARFGERMRGLGPYADLIARRFELACARLGLKGDREREPLDRSQFRPPARDGGRQASLF